VLLYLTRGPAALVEQLTSGHGWFELLSYVLVTVLAVVGYGAVFLAAGVFFKNPIVPAIAILGWESINAL
jgi:fumarate reductase subunit C